MRNLRLFAMLVLASLAAVSFTSCGSDDDNGFDYDNLESCTWEQLSSKANFLSNFPKLDGTFSDESVVLNTNTGDREADMVMFTYNISNGDLDSYIQKLADNKFCVNRIGVLFADKVANGCQYSLEYEEGTFIFIATKYLNSSDYETAFENYQERLANSTPTNATWEDVVSEYGWLNNLPAPDFNFTNYRVVEDDEIALTGEFSATSLESYAKKLEADGFVEMPETSRSMFKKEFGDGGYYFVTMNEVMIDFRDFTNTDNDEIVVSDWRD